MLWVLAITSPMLSEAAMSSGAILGLVRAFQ